MKKIGILGGVTWSSTADYYRLINQKVNKGLGGYQTARILISSVNFHDVMGSLSRGNWNEVEELFVQEAIGLKQAGAELLAISSNTIAKVAENVAERAAIPLVSIIDATAQEIKAKGFNRVGFIGTEFTMKSTFYLDRLGAHGIDSFVPNSDEIATISNIIMDELAHGVVKEKSRQNVLNIIERLYEEENAGGVVLGCTEIPMLISQDDTSIHIFDTTEIHTDYIVDSALQ